MISTARTEPGSLPWATISYGASGRVDSSKGASIQAIGEEGATALAELQAETSRAERIIAWRMNLDFLIYGSPETAAAFLLGITYGAGFLMKYRKR